MEIKREDGSFALILVGGSIMEFTKTIKYIDNAILKQRITNLSKALEKYSPALVVAYLFGSRVNGKIRPLSDIDIALLFSSDDIEKHLEAKVLIDIMEVLKTDKVDLVNLNEAPLHIQYGVLKNKKIIFCSNKKKRLDFETTVIKEYLDFKHIREAFNQQFLKNIGIGVEKNG